MKHPLPERKKEQAKNILYYSNPHTLLISDWFVLLDCISAVSHTTYI